MSTPNPLQTSAPIGTGAIPSTPQDARMQLEQLRQDRIDGKVMERDYLERSDYLSRLAHGEQAAPPRPAPITPEERANAEYASHMKPPDSPTGYRLSPAPPGDTRPAAERDAFEADVRGAFHAMGMPQHLAGAIYSRIDELAAQMAKADQTVIDARIAGGVAELRREWGSEYEARTQAISRLLETANSSFIDDFVSSAPWALVDPAIAEYLWRVARHRGG